MRKREPGIIIAPRLAPADVNEWAGKGFQLIEKENG